MADKSAASTEQAEISISVSCDRETWPRIRDVLLDAGICAKLREENVDVADFRVTYAGEREEI